MKILKCELPLLPPPLSQGYSDTEKLNKTKITAAAKWIIFSKWDIRKEDTDYVVAEAFPFMFFKCSIERSYVFIKSLTVPSQELSNIFNVFKWIGVWWSCRFTYNKIQELTHRVNICMVKYILSLHIQPACVHWNINSAYCTFN